MLRRIINDQYLIGVFVVRRGINVLANGSALTSNIYRHPHDALHDVMVDWH